jgi:hypothetical protein
MEYTPIGVSISPRTGTGMTLDGLLMDGVEVFNGVDPMHSYQGAGTRYLLASAPSGSTYYLRTEGISIRKARSYEYGGTYHVEALSNGNGNAATAFIGTEIEGGSWYGPASAIAHSDATGKSIDIRGPVMALAGYQTGANVPVCSNMTCSTALPTGGLSFPAAQVPSSDPNTLTDYETGTWTPTDASVAGLAFTNTSGNCFYTKVGRLVHVTGRVTFPSTADTNTVLIGGLPFTAFSTTASVQGGVVSYTNAGISPSILVGGNATSFSLYDNTGTTVKNNTMSSKDVRFVLTYEATQ